MINKPYESKIHPLRIILIIFFLILVPFFIWASWAHIDRVSHARGQVIAAAKTQQIQAAIDGVVETIHVQEGEQVKKGQLLVSLERDRAKAAYEDKRAKVAALRAALDRLRAEVYEKPLKFASDLENEYPEFVENQRALFKRRQQALHDELNTLTESLRLAQEELDLNLPLLKKGDIGAIEVIRLKRQIADLKGKIANAKNKYFRDSQADMTKAEEELSQREQELEDRRVTLERTQITAPMDAIVKNILVTTIGAHVRPGDVIMELVPWNDRLIIEAKMKPADISFVKVGQKAGVKLDAYDYTIYGIFYGKVIYISPDALVERTSKGDEYYFRVLIGMDSTTLTAKNGKKIALSPGMTAQVDIVTGSRSVLSYLSKPLIKTLSEAMHER